MVNLAQIFNNKYQPLLEKFQSSAISELFNAAISASKNSADHYINIVCANPNGLWTCVSFQKGSKIENTHNVIGKQANANFMGMITDDDIYNKQFMNKDAWEKYTNKADLNQILQVTKSKGLFALVIVDDDLKNNKSIIGGALLNGSINDKITKFFNTQQNREGNSENNEAEEKAEVSKLQKDFMKNHSQDDYNKIINFVKMLNNNKYLDKDVKEYFLQTKQVNNNEAKARQAAQTNIMSVLLAYGNSSDKNAFKNHSQVWPKVIKNTPFVHNMCTKLYDWYDQNMSGKKQDDNKDKQSDNQNNQNGQNNQQNNQNNNQNNNQDNPFESYSIKRHNNLSESKKRQIYESVMRQVSRIVKQQLNKIN